MTEGASKDRPGRRHERTISTKAADAAMKGSISARKVGPMRRTAGDGGGGGGAAAADAAPDPPALKTLQRQATVKLQSAVRGKIQRKLHHAALLASLQATPAAPAPRASALPLRLPPLLLAPTRQLLACRPRWRA